MKLLWLFILLAIDPSTPFVVIRPRRAITTIRMHSFWVSDALDSLDTNALDAPAAPVDPVAASSFLEQAGEGLRAVAIGLTAIVFALAGLTYLFASILIPKAAEQLEKEAKELAPDLWEEYQAKLGEGETMATRPDLMQELGNKLQPLLDAKIANMQTKSQPTTKEEEEKVIDAQVVDTTVAPDTKKTNDDDK